MNPPPPTLTAAPTTLGQRGKSPRRPLFLWLGLGALWFVCCRHLSEEWRFNEQYSYGWFVPFFVAYLLYLRWEDRPEPGRASAVGKTVTFFALALATLTLLPLRVFEIGSSDWRPLGWVHALAITGITLGLIYLAGGARWLRHFSFPILFFLTAVPWVTAIEGPVTQGLMRIIAMMSAETVTLFGVPAVAQGNLVQLPNGLVGVNEACSGVRSLQTSIMIGLLFGELKRLRVWSRVVLVATAVGIALFANFLRVLFLVSMASTHDISAVDKWHDIAGYGILALVFAGTMFLASRFRSNVIDAPAGQRSLLSFSPSLRTFAVILLLWTIAVEVGAEYWYRIHERNLVSSAPWGVRWPENAPDYKEIKIDELSRELLRFDEGKEVAWRSGDVLGQAVNYLFFFRWNPGSGTILRARAHRPDICLPSAGWKQVGADRVEKFPIGDGRDISFRQFTFENTGNPARPLHAFAYYCLHEDQIHRGEGNVEDSAGLYSNWDFADRWRVVKSGIRNLGQQVMQVLVVRPGPVRESEPSPDDHFRAVLRQVISPGK